MISVISERRQIKNLVSRIKDTERSFYIHTLGCKVNQAESEKIASIFLSSGYEFNENVCDIVILNTCAVTSEAESKSRKILRRLIRCMKPRLVFVIGCASKMIIESINEIGNEVIIVIPPSLKKDFIENLERVFSVDSSFYTGRRTRAFLKIQDGCNRRCAYCIVPFLRGNEVSVSISEVLKEAEKLNAEGVKEVVLTGVHLGRYRFGDSNLAFLLETLAKKFDFRIRLSSIDVEDINEDLVKTAFELGERFCPHFHIPLQSGSNKILKAMKRPYTAEYFLRKVEFIRSIFEEVALSTDVMVGFPGETDIDFQKTVDLINQAEFMRLHVFRFSKRPGTEAEKMTDSVPVQLTKERENYLINLSKTLENDFKKKLNGRVLNVLVEKTDGNSSFGRSEYYVDVICPTKYVRGEIVKVKAKYDNETIVGEVDSCREKTAYSAKL